MISILHPEQSRSDARPIPGNLLYRLSLDRSFSYICADMKKRDYFLSVVSELTGDRDEILYRQEILKDLEGNPGLLERLVSLYARFEELRTAQKNAGREEFRLNAAGTASPASSKNLLGVQALCLKRALLFVKACGELLAQYPLRSRGLKGLCSVCGEMSKSPDAAELTTLCSRYERFSESGYWDFRFSLNGEGRIGEWALTDHGYIHVTDPEMKKKGFSLFRKTEENVFPCQRLAPDGDGLFDELAAAALSDLAGAFGRITEQIFEKFGPIGRELVFYEAALGYIRALSEKHVPFCYPAFPAEQGVRVRKLYDLYLLLSGPGSGVTPNDFVLNPGGGGTLIFGNNGSGKTVYLRSVGTAQLLAQAGLPIPCESAEMTVFTQLAAQFSEAEKDFCPGNDAGRFEQEVRELAVMTDTLKEGALVLLNETFQSTAYAEGAEGLYHLLEYFSSVGIRWILVSHLRQLEEMFRGEDVTVLHTADGYRIMR